MCGDEIKKVTMKNDFNGVLKKNKLNNTDYEFLYTPCLHIQTFRVAETYGDAVIKFKKNINSYI